MGLRRHQTARAPTTRFGISGGMRRQRDGSEYDLDAACTTPRRRRQRVGRARRALSMLLRRSTGPQLRCEAYGLGRCPKLNGRAVDDNRP